MNILVVDDDRLWSTFVQQTLESDFTEIQVIAADGALDGLKLLGEQAFDVVVVDYYMPEMDGLSLVTNLRSGAKGLAQNMDAGVVFLSSYESSSIVVDAMKAGADEYVVKSAKASEAVCAAVRAAYDAGQSRREKTPAMAKTQDIDLQLLAEAKSLSVLLLDKNEELLFVTAGMQQWLAANALEPSEISLESAQQQPALGVEVLTSGKAQKGTLVFLK